MTASVVLVMLLNSYRHDHGLLRRAITGLRFSLLGFLALVDLPVEGFEGVFAIPTQGVAEFVDHRTSTRSVPAWITLPAALQIFFFACMTHDPGSFFIWVSFFLAQRPTKADFSSPLRCHSTWRNAQNEESINRDRAQFELLYFANRRIGMKRGYMIFHFLYKRLAVAPAKWKLESKEGPYRRLPLASC